MTWSATKRRFRLWQRKAMTQTTNRTTYSIIVNRYMKWMNRSQSQLEIPTENHRKALSTTTPVVVKKRMSMKKSKTSKNVPRRTLLKIVISCTASRPLWSLALILLPRLR